MDSSTHTKTRLQLTSDQVRSLLKDESLNLYDYLMRMTGQMERSAESCEEVARVVNKWFEKDPSFSYKLVRKKFYMTARSFNADIWQGDVENLQNAAYSPDHDPEGPALQQQYLELESHLNQIDSMERELILLKFKYGFDSQEIRELTKISDDIEPIISKALSALSTQLPIEELSERIAEIPLHPKPESVTHQTQALSQLMRDIKSRRPAQSPYALIFGGLAVAAVLLFIIRVVFFG